MKIFESMLDKVLIDKFIKRKELKLKYGQNQEDFIKLKNYITSDKYINDVNRLKNGDYYISIPKRIKIKKINSTKRRICYFYEENEMFLFKFMTYVLMHYDYLYEDSLYSFRKFKTHKDFFNKLKPLDKNRQLYVLKVDIKGYGESVDQDILLEKLKKIFASDDRFYNFIYWLLKRNKFVENGNVESERISIIPGTPMGAFFNNIYLTDIDKYINNNCILYMRYADDIAVFVDDYNKANDFKNYITKSLIELKLQLNQNKTKIYKPKESFSILGMNVSEDGYDMAEESYRKIIFKLKHRLNRLLVLYRTKKISSERAITLYINFINKYFYGSFDSEHEINWTAWAFGIITKIDSLKSLDSYIQNSIRTIISKKKSKVKYNIKYDDLKKYGYKNLVHYYYHNHEK